MWPIPYDNPHGLVTNYTPGGRSSSRKKRRKQVLRSQRISPRGKSRNWDAAYRSWRRSSHLYNHQRESKRAPNDRIVRRGVRNFPQSLIGTSLGKINWRRRGQSRGKRGGRKKKNCSSKKHSSRRAKLERSDGESYAETKRELRPSNERIRGRGGEKSVDRTKRGSAIHPPGKIAKRKHHSTNEMRRGSVTGGRKKPK